MPIMHMSHSKGRWADADAAYTNRATFNDYVDRLENIAISQFEWNGIPDSIEEHFIEQTLIERGYCLYFRDEVMGDLALPCTLGPGLDVYNVPVFRRAYAFNGYNRICDNHDSVLIYNNYLHTPSYETILLFARRLYEIERTIDVNVKAQKTPVLVTASEEQELTIKNVFARVTGNEPAIFARKNFDPHNFQVLKTDAPFVADKLQILKRQIWNEFLTYIGIENANTEKRERLVTDEITSNLGGVEANRNVMLVARQEAAAKINRMFGTDITVNFRQDFTEVLDDYGPDIDEPDGDNNG